MSPTAGWVVFAIGVMIFLSGVAWSYFGVWGQ